MPKTRSVSVEDCIIIMLLATMFKQKRVAEIMKLGTNTIYRTLKAQTNNSQRSKAMFAKLKSLESVLFPTDELKEKKQSIAELRIIEMFGSEAGWDTLNQKKAEDRYKSRNRYTGY